MSNTEIETRLANLETELKKLRADIHGDAKKPWWENIVGKFADDPIYDEAMQLGREYRESLRDSEDACTGL